MRVAVASYQRPEALATKTLPLLRRLGLDAVTDVFLSDPTERDAYQAAARDYPDVQWIDSVLGMHQARNAIQLHYPEGQRVLCLDDDIGDLVAARNAKQLVSVGADEFEGILDLAWQSSRGGLWGINAVANPYFMRKTVTYDLRYIVGCFYGWTTRHDPALLLEYDAKDDFERSIKWYLADGRVTRLNWVAPRTKYFDPQGGQSAAGRTPRSVVAECQALAADYPSLCKYTVKKSGWADVRLRDTRRAI